METYIRRCDCQPLSIFDVDDLRQNFGSCKPEVLFSILALSLRFSESSQLLGETAQLALQYTNATRKIIMGKIVEGDVEMTTLQALCLHAFFDIISIIAAAIRDFFANIVQLETYNVLGLA